MAPSNALLCGSLALAVAWWPALANAQDDARLLPTGTFLAGDGTERPLRQTHEEGLHPLRNDPRYFRAAVEAFSVLLVGEAYYWIRPSINKEDWDFPDGKTRLENFVPSFDTNLHVTNDILHPLGPGAWYYWIARENGINIPLSLLYSATTSALFEFVGEILEKASINDLIVTPMGGLSTGEFFTHLSDYLNSAPNPRWGHDVAGWTLGLPHRANRPGWYSGPANALPPDNLGFSSYHWHRFQLGVGEMLATNDLGRQDFMYDFRADAEFVSIPGFLRPGRFVLPFHNGELTEGHFRASFGSGGNQTWDINFAAHLTGRYEQNVSRDRVGHAWMVSLQSAYDFAERYRLGRYDAWALVHLLGPAIRWWGVDHDLIADLELAVAPDFAVIQSQAWPEWKARFTDQGQKSELIAQGYYFAYGWSPRLRATLAWHGVELGSRVTYGMYGSFDKGDRFQENLTNNPHDTDQIAEIDTWLKFRVPNTPLMLRAYATHTGRYSTITPLATRTWDRQYGANFGVIF